MGRRRRIIYTHRLNKEVPDKGWIAEQMQHCGNNNKDKDNSTYASNANKYLTA